MSEEIKKYTSQDFSVQITENGRQMLILNDRIDSLLSRISFHEDFGLTISEKKELGKTMIDRLYKILKNRDSNDILKNWSEKCQAFKEAYYSDSKTKLSITWLLINILNISQEEAEKRFDIAEELMSLPDFKYKENAIIDRVYLNKKNILPL